MVNKFHYTDIMSCTEIRESMLDVDSLDLDTAKKILSKFLNEELHKDLYENRIDELEEELVELEDDNHNLEVDLIETTNDLRCAINKIAELEELVSKLRNDSHMDW